MLALFTWLTTSKIGKEVGIAVLILGALAGIYMYGHSAGFHDGHTAGGKETFDQLKNDMDAERAATAANIAAINQQMASKDAIVSQQQAIIGTQAGILAGLQQQQVTLQHTIAGLSDQQVVLDLAGRLKLRAPGDTTPTLYPAEVRHADEIVGDYAIVTQKVDALTAKSNAQGEQITALQDKGKLADQKFQTAMDYISESDKRFVNAYNVFESIEGRPLWQKILTFGILHNKKIKSLTPIVPLAKPAELK